LAPTKKRPIEPVVLTFADPVGNAAAAVKAMSKLGFEVREDTKPWREAIGYQYAELPEVFLADARNREGMTQLQLSQ
jgi:hypothetical protein